MENFYKNIIIFNIWYIKLFSLFFKISLLIWRILIVFLSFFIKIIDFYNLWDEISRDKFPQEIPSKIYEHNLSEVFISWNAWTILFSRLETIFLLADLMWFDKQNSEQFYWSVEHRFPILNMEYNINYLLILNLYMIFWKMILFNLFLFFFFFTSNLHATTNNTGNRKRKAIASKLRTLNTKNGRDKISTNNEVSI